MKARFMKNTSGFSLVELMVVVAIIGILATVAIPSVNKYMAKARQTEAKTNLAAIYSANKAFSVEYNTYGSHFNVIGFAPEGQLRYNVGFATAFTVANYSSAGWTGSVNAASSSASGVCSTGGTVPSTGLFRCSLLAEGAARPLPASSATAAGFVAGASSSLVTGSQLDQWTINDAKQIINTQSAL